MVVGACSCSYSGLTVLTVTCGEMYIIESRVEIIWSVLCSCFCPHHDVYGCIDSSAYIDSVFSVSARYTIFVFCVS